MSPHSMNSFLFVIAIGSFAVILLDTIGSFASRTLGFPYAWLIIVSVFIYATAGFAAEKYGSTTLAAVVGGIVGFVDSTIGWYISWVIGPGRPAIEVEPTGIVSAIAFVTLIGVMFGFLGGQIARLI